MAVRRLLPFAVATLALVGAVRAVRAERAAVLAVDTHAGEVYVDRGTAAGVGPGARLVLYHIVIATHPVTGAKVRDAFPIGDLEVINAGRAISVARGDAELMTRIAVGDQVELRGEPRDYPDPWRARTRPRGDEAQGERLAIDRERQAAERKAQRDAAVARLAAEEAARNAFTDSLGLGLEQRIDLWKAYLAAYPESPYRAAVTAELDSLRDQLARERARDADAGSATRLRRDLEVLLGGQGHQLTAWPLLALPPRRAYQGGELELAFHTVGAGDVARAWLYYRRAGETTYRRAPLERGGDGYLRQRISGAIVMPPRLEYFVEVLLEGAAEPKPAFASADEPATVAVDASVEEAPDEIRGRTQLTLRVDYVDFDGPGRNFDEYVVGEVDMMYRFRAPIHALRLGFGAYGGKGGPKDVIDDSPTEDCRDEAGVYRCRRVDFHYAFLELEHRFADLVAVMLRPMVGSAWREDAPAGDAERQFFESFGLRGRIRLGAEQGTNVVLGVQLVEEFGTAFEGAFIWDVIPRFPVVIAATVTDQPVPEDFGVRLIADVGYRGLAWLYPSLRVSYQARDLDHAGFGGGLALNFDW
jgi:hypothetical protein